MGRGSGINHFANAVQLTRPNFCSTRLHPFHQEVNPDGNLDVCLGLVSRFTMGISVRHDRIWLDDKHLKGVPSGTLSFGEPCISPLSYLGPKPWISLQPTSQLSALNYGIMFYPLLSTPLLKQGLTRLE